MKTEIKTVTPEMAKEMLKRNSINRPLKDGNVRKFAEAMRKGQWKLTGQGLQISEFGNLIDGQHRLAALIMADVSLPFLICYEVREAHFEVLDQGAARTAQDVLAIKGVSNYTNIAAAIKKCLLISQMRKPAITSAGLRPAASQAYGSKAVTNSDVVEYYLDNSEICHRAHRLCDVGYLRFKLLNKSLTTGLYLFLTVHKKHKEETVEQFIKELTGISNTNVSAITILRQKLINASASKSYKLEPKAINAMLIIAWQDYITGRYDRKSLQIDPEKEYYFV